MKIITGDIRSEKNVKEAVKDVDCIINCASYFCIDLEPDLHKLNSTNVDGNHTSTYTLILSHYFHFFYLGTNNLINYAIKNNVKYFVQLSTIDIFCGTLPIFYGSEITTLVPTDRVLDPYAKTKLEADNIVTNANGMCLENGKFKWLLLLDSLF
jgi:hypothetical protein